MKHIALAALFATSLVAQTPTKQPESQIPAKERFQVSTAVQLELAAIIAVEEQERDLTKAQQLYEAAMVDQQLSKEARGYAAYRLAFLLRRLGKREQAKQVLLAAGHGLVATLDDVTNDGQDPERDKQLRLQARELLRKGTGNDLNNLVENLRWIGTPAIPEVIAYLQDGLAQASQRGDPWATPELFAFLWECEGPQVSRFLTDAASNRYSHRAASTASHRQEIDVDSAEVRAFLEHEHWGQTELFLYGVRNKLPADALLTLFDRGGNQAKAYVLVVLSERELSDAQRAQAHAICRAAIAGTSPELAQAAIRFLVSGESQKSLEGILMLLRVLSDQTDIRRDNLATLTASSVGGQQRTFSKDEVAQVLPELDTCVQRTGRVETGALRALEPVSLWLWHLMDALMRSGGEQAVPQAMVMWDLGYPMAPVFSGHVTSTHAVELLKRWQKVQPDQILPFVRAFRDVRLSAAELPLLREIAEELAGTLSSQAKQAYALLVGLVGAIGDDAAAMWLQEQWRARNLASQTVSRSQGVATFHSTEGNDAFVSALLEIGRSNKSAQVREVMRNMVRGVGGHAASDVGCAQLLLALLSMSDEQARKIAVEGVGNTHVAHPYDESDQPARISPLHYLVYSDPKPAHGYTEQQVLATVRECGRHKVPVTLLSPLEMRVDAIADAVLCALAEEILGSISMGSIRNASWDGVLVKRLDERIRAGGDTAILEACFLAALGKPSTSSDWSCAGRPAILTKYRQQLLGLVDGESGAWATTALTWLASIDEPLDAAALLLSRHQQVRWWIVDELVDGDRQVAPSLVVPLLRDRSIEIRRLAAVYLGAKVEKAAVPGLIELLKDPSEAVRTQASASLTSIRFYHEQQAHWDRVLRGLDASSASAAEKLLLQAKPSANKQQRLLAIASLGVLAVPEALPFLIEWSQEADAEISAAAKAAITKIHLNPRK